MLCSSCSMMNKYPTLPIDLKFGYNNNNSPPELHIYIFIFKNYLQIFFKICLRIFFSTSQFCPQVEKLQVRLDRSYAEKDKLEAKLEFSQVDFFISILYVPGKFATNTNLLKHENCNICLIFFKSYIM